MIIKDNAMKKLIFLLALAATACATKGVTTQEAGGSTSNAGSADNTRAEACNAWQAQRRACEKFNARSSGLDKDGKVFACMKARGFGNKPQGCN